MGRARDSVTGQDRNVTLSAWDSARPQLRELGASSSDYLSLSLLSEYKGSRLATLPTSTHWFIAIKEDKCRTMEYEWVKSRL